MSNHAKIDEIKSLGNYTVSIAIFLPCRHCCAKISHDGASVPGGKECIDGDTGES